MFEKPMAVKALMIRNPLIDSSTTESRPAKPRLPDFGFFPEVPSDDPDHIACHRQKDGHEKGQLRAHDHHGDIIGNDRNRVAEDDLQVMHDRNVNLLDISGDPGQ